MKKSFSHLDDRGAARMVNVAAKPAQHRRAVASGTLVCARGTIRALKAAALPHINITAKANDYGLYQGSMSNHDKVIQNVVDVLHHRQPIMTTAWEGREVVHIIAQMYGSAVEI